MADVFRFKVCLRSCGGGEYPPSKCFRVLDISGGKSLAKLAEGIIKAFDFDFDHAFGFYDNLNRYHDSEERYTLFADMEDIDGPSDGKSVKKTKIKDVFVPGKSMLFLFDYGDEWMFSVNCVSVSPAEKGAKYPLVAERKGKSPEQYPAYEEEEA
jgi:hypothetical protein